MAYLQERAEEQQHERHEYEGVHVVYHGACVQGVDHAGCPMKNSTIVRDAADVDDDIDSD